MEVCFRRVPRIRTGGSQGRGPVVGQTLPGLATVPRTASSPKECCPGLEFFPKMKGKKWYLSIALTSISLIKSKIEYLFTYLNGLSVQ